jgi:DNA repair exonuclease SbcCD ATPase subunit
VSVARAREVYQQLYSKMSSAQGQKEMLEAQLANGTAALERATEDQRINAEAQMLLSAVATERQGQFRQSLETLVTHGLQTVFGDESLHFHIVEEVKAGRPQVSFEVESTMGDETVRTSVMDARGGGLASVVGFFIRLSVLLLSGHRRIMLLDETFAQLSAGYEPQMAEWLADLCVRAEVQIVMVTHSDAYSEHADVVYRTSQSGGVTSVERVR